MAKIKTAKTKPAPLLLRKKIYIRSHQGLHARPAALFVQVANRFKSKIRVRKGSHVVDGKSIMGLLTLAAERGATLEIIVEGPDGREALHALEQLISHRDVPAVVTVVRHRSTDGSTSKR